jgi:endothelin-converting enzyme/putative endopeptidase
LPSCSGTDDATSSPTGIDETFLDRSADPCSDFYQFACGTWIAQHPVPAGYVQSRFFESDNRNDFYYQKLVTDSTSSDPDLAKAQQFHGSCMASRANSVVAPEVLAAQLAAVSTMTMSDLPSTLADLHAAGVSALFSADAGIDPGQPSRRVMELFDAGWSLPTKERYGNSPDGMESAYEGHMTALIDLAVSIFASSATPVAAYLGSFDAKAVFQFEKAIADASLDRAAFSDPVATYHLLDQATLTSMVPAFDWAGYFAAAGVSLEAGVDVGEPAFFASLQNLLSATPVAVIGQYLAWRVLEAEASTVGKALIDEEFRFHEGVLYGQMQANPDWYICLIATRREFGFALAKSFVDRFVPPETKQRAGELVSSIQGAMRADLSSLAWIDGDTRAQALAKLDALLPKVAYPDRWPVYGGLNLTSSTSYLDNVVDVRRYYRGLALAQLQMPVDRTVFAASPDTTNAFYSPSRNDITIPVAILDQPFFDPANSPVLNFGAIGSIIGHEITHGFDNYGRHFDGAGRLTDWWTPSVEAEFGTRAQCLVDQYSAYEPVAGAHVDGALTLGENIADLGGLKLAYAAHQATGGDKLTTGFDADQQFFLSYAQTRCANPSPDFLGVSILVDPHSPEKYRVNGAVRNVPAFAAAFHCAEGAPLAPPAAERCEVW